MGSDTVSRNHDSLFFVEIFFTGNFIKTEILDSMNLIEYMG